jgi:hypothetical protein
MKLRTRSQNTSHCDFLTELEFFFRRHLQAAEMDIGGASHYLRLADEIARLACSHWVGCPICRGGRAKWHGAPRAKAPKNEAQELWDKVRRWIGVPSFESALEPRLGYCWVARLTVSKGRFTYIGRTVMNQKRTTPALTRRCVCWIQERTTRRHQSQNRSR